MTLVVEDGTGVANADSFLSLVDARALAAQYGIVIDADDTKAEVELRTGYRGLLTSESTLQGTRTHDIQTGIFPRTGVVSNCVEVDSELIPVDVKLAQLYYQAAINGGYDNNGVNDGQNLKSFEVPQVYKEEYQDNARVKTNATISGVDNALYSFTLAGLANSPCGRNAGLGGLVREEFWL